jgi:exodeoxyribonuclease VII large subunit
VARAIYDSELPVISAVGHEIDFSISDFVADLRAPTPSAAAEMAVPDGEQLSARFQGYYDSIAAATISLIDRSKRRLHELSTRYGLRRPLEIISQRAQRRDELSRLINLQMTHRMESLRHRSQSIFEKLGMVSPKAVMKRGFSYCRDEKGAAIRSFKQVAIDDKLEIVLYEGGLESRVTRIQPDIFRSIKGG